ncbi:hypothetical protein N7468_000544 [Penicillium chermesinum]|uniref:Zn(2)-C6 fungal-type domain-containing protein n=1 Tax=Penicillium chermesinum TaxID=63820 RepID=A0A9W9TYG1_9EURO|nr:uncharacterized protein N7468_000544 [Penicillium chermesinum]KAJ5249093.1 hypothetical protein N7468_000544 [Penicillium chermesinum]
MENIKIPSPSAILDSEPAASVRGKPASTQAPTQAPTQKPKQTKSRNGCITCKAKRLKCDETKPSCHQCERRKVVCGGYKKDFKWRPFEETNLAVGRPTPNAAKPKKANHSAQPPITNSNANSFPTPPTTEQSASPVRASHLPPTSPHESFQSSPASIKSYVSGDAPSIDEIRRIPPDPSPSDDAIPGLAVSHSLEADSLNFLSFLEPFQGPVPFGDDLIPDADREPSSVPTFDPQTYQPSESGMSFSQLVDDNEDIEDIIRQSDPISGWSLSFPREETNIFDMARLPGQPSLAPESQEMLAMRFDRLTCGILSVKDGISENPWRTLVWPLAKGTPALYHALFALSAFHSSKENPSLRVQGVKHMRQSISCLRQDIQGMRADTALATSLALAFADTWDQNTRTCIQHLKGAKALMLQCLHSGLSGALNGEELGRIRFLYNTWTYMDVIARLTSLDEAGSQDLSPSIFHLPGDAVHEIDPLMGCATTLFPLIGRVARLVQRVRKTTTNSVSIVAQAMELKTLIQQWEPPQWFEPPEDPTSEVQHSIQVAHAYRWATLLYLHQAVPEMPSESAEELGKRVLILLATVPYTSRTTIIQMFPLLAAGAEMDAEDDRKWVMDRWMTIQSRLMLGGIDRCVDVIREVWSRRDAAKAKKQQEMAASRRSGSFSNENPSQMSPSMRSPDGNGSSKRSFHHRTSSVDQDRFVSGALSSSVPKLGQPRRGSVLSSLENIEFERTVRSRLHWVNIMSEWGWEGKRPEIFYAKSSALTRIL